MLEVDEIDVKLVVDNSVTGFEYFKLFGPTHNQLFQFGIGRSLWILRVSGRHLV